MTSYAIADAFADAMAEAGVTEMFVYPGTSELRLCVALRDVGMTLYQACGDTEAVFLAGGAARARPGRAACVLHGARGLGAATGAITDLARNEVGVVVVVGLASRQSAPFLPPHAEPEFFDAVARFVKDAVALDELGDRSGSEVRAAVERLVSGSRTAPCGPVLLGIPQDVAETPAEPRPPASSDAAGAGSGGGVVPSTTEAALAALDEADRIVVLVDDYLFGDQDAARRLDDFATSWNAPVLQVMYRRGPMLFERLSPSVVSNFLGWLDRAAGGREGLLAVVDLLVTVEDRNMYPRVVGRLPECRKIAITTTSVKARKNGYLSPEDVVVEGPVSQSLEALTRRGPEGAETWWHEYETADAAPSNAWLSPAMRDVVTALAKGLHAAGVGVLFDDSQLLGGALTFVYDALPAGLRIYGDHAGFVGSGIGLATGYALAHPGTTVACLLGDHGFVNGIKGLFAAHAYNARVGCVVCSNGTSVSLAQQARETFGEQAEQTVRELMRSACGSPAALANAIGVRSESLSFEDEEAPARLASIMARLASQDGPWLVDLRLASDLAFWSGIWSSQGFDESGSDAPGG